VGGSGVVQEGVHPVWLRQPALQEWACRCNPHRRSAEVAVVVWGANIHLCGCHQAGMALFSVISRRGQKCTEFSEAI
jgi:hypothetical protein